MRFTQSKSTINGGVSSFLMISMALTLTSSVISAPIYNNDAQGLSIRSTNTTTTPSTSSSGSNDATANNNNNNSAPVGQDNNNDNNNNSNGNTNNNVISPNQLPPGAQINPIQVNSLNQIPGMQSSTNTNPQQQQQGGMFRVIQIPIQFANDGYDSYDDDVGSQFEGMNNNVQSFPGQQQQFQQQIYQNQPFVPIRGAKVNVIHVLQGNGPNNGNISPSPSPPPPSNSNSTSNNIGNNNTNNNNDNIGNNQNNVINNVSQSATSTTATSTTSSVQSNQTPPPPPPPPAGSGSGSDSGSGSQ